MTRVSTSRGLMYSTPPNEGADDEPAAEESADD